MRNDVDPILQFSIYHKLHSKLGQNWKKKTSRNSEDGVRICSTIDWGVAEAERIISRNN